MYIQQYNWLWHYRTTCLCSELKVEKFNVIVRDRVKSETRILTKAVKFW